MPPKSHSMPCQSDTKKCGVIFPNSNIFKWFIKLICLGIKFINNLVQTLNDCLQWHRDRPIHSKKNSTNEKKTFALNTKSSTGIKTTPHIWVSFRGERTVEIKYKRTRTILSKKAWTQTNTNEQICILKKSVSKFF